MKNYVIVTDSCSDLDKVDRVNYNIEYIKMHFSYGDKDFEADLDWQNLPYEEFYGVMRDGVRIITSQVNTEQFKIAFEEYAKNGYDILYVGCSSALSGSVRASLIAREDVLKTYPDAKIICIDSINACMGLGLLCITASKLRSRGLSIEEVASFIEENKKFMRQEATVEKLTWLKMAGRVSATSAFFGGILNVKPIIASSDIGANVAVEKVKGRKVSIQRLAQRMQERYVSCEHQAVCVVHGDSEEDANLLVEEVRKILPEKDKDIEISVRRLGPCIGATCGPGTLGLYYFGTDKTKEN